MYLIRNMKLEIQEKEIIRLLGYNDESCSEEIKSSIKEELKKYSKYIRPQVLWDKIEIDKLDENKVVLKNGVVFEDEFIAKKLSDCKYVIVAIMTIGHEIDKIISEAFEGDDYLKGMIVESIGIAVLSYINKQFWGELIKEIKGTNWGITSRISPGDNQIALTEQKKIFQCLNGEEIGVSLTNSNMMFPIKSSTIIYGFGENIGILLEEHECDQCSMINCAFRKSKPVKVTINYDNKVKTIEVNKGITLLKALRDNDVIIHNPCSGKGYCGKCKVLIMKGASAAGDLERDTLSAEEIEKGIRLACQLKIEKSLEVLVEAKSEKMKVLTEGNEKKVNIEPMITKKYLELPLPSIEDQTDDFKRIKNEIGIKNMTVGYELLLQVGRILRQWDFKVTATLYENELLELEGSDTSEKRYGIAFDIGTTTIVAYLINLVNGETIDEEAQINNQKIFGADVISRINYTIENESEINTLKNTIAEQINNIIAKVSNRNNISINNIYNVVIAGNTIMLHFLLGLDTKQIALAPFVPIITEAVDIRAKEIGIKINGIVSIMPGISAYIGSDITAGILSTDILKSDKYSILLDLGTNGEIVLANKDDIITCSTAAGPAFEGVNIKCGIGGVDGAIQGIDLKAKKIYKTIGDFPPIGICGSGVMDIVSQFIKYGIIDDTGRMMEKHEIIDDELKEKIFDVNGVKEFVITKEPRLVFTQKDIREVQLAKAAVAAGIQLLLKERNIGYEDIENVFIGGGFGNFMNVESAINIGLLPRELENKIYSIGNCAGSGAKQYLISKECREVTKIISDKAKYIELSNKKDFQDYFVENMIF